VSVQALCVKAIIGEGGALDLDAGMARSAKDAFMGAFLPEGRLIMSDVNAPAQNVAQRVGTLLFLWENIGPMHADRLRAVAGACPGTRVVAIELFDQSQVYAWEPVRGSEYEVRTLVPSGRRCSKLRLVARMVRAVLAYPHADCYLCHYERVSVLITALVLRLCGRRVFALFNSKFDDYPRALFVEIIKFLFMLPYKGALCGSPRSIAYLTFLGLPPNKLELGYNTLSVDRIAELGEAPPAPGGLSFEERDFVVVARFVPKKNLSLVIDAYAFWLRQAGYPRDLHLCGSGPLEAALREQVARLGLVDRVHFHGFVQTEAVSRILARALCLILPSIEEQFGNVVIEAQALGVPALVSTVAGAADVMIDSGVNGFVIGPDRPEAWAALMALLSEDRILWSRFASAAYASRTRGDVSQFVAGVKRLSAIGGQL
jgi:glycosyltransferase involved in cell wall biosynthesis